MHQCSHCKEPGVNGQRKWASNTSDPTECKRCGGLSALPAVTVSGVPVASALLLTAGGFLAAVLAVLAFYVWRWHVAPLAKVSSAEQRNSARILAKAASLLAV